MANKKRKGPRHSPGELTLMKRVSREFRKKKEELGSAKKAADQLGVHLKSFYKYMEGSDLPRIEVLRRAERLWKIKWPMLNLSEMSPLTDVRNHEQLAFSFS